MTLTVYLATAVVLVPFIFAVAEWFGRRPPPFHRLQYSLIAAGLWPLLAVGLAQLALIVAVRRIGADVKAHDDTPRHATGRQALAAVQGVVRP